MIDTNLEIEKREASESKPIPEDMYQVELLDIDSKVEETYNSKKARKEDPTLEVKKETILSFQFVLLDGMEKDKSLRGRSIWANFIPTYLYISSKNGKNKTYQIVEALLGHELSPEEEATMDGGFLNKLIGNQCRIVTINNASGDKTYTNIDRFLKATTVVNGLTDEEREKATPKKLSGTAQPQTTGEAVEEDINPDDIPF